MVDIADTGCLRCVLPGKVPGDTFDNEGNPVNPGNPKEVSCCWDKDSEFKKLGRSGFNWKCSGLGVIEGKLGVKVGQFPEISAGLADFGTLKDAGSSQKICEILGDNAFKDDPKYSKLTGDPNVYPFGCGADACKAVVSGGVSDAIQSEINKRKTEGKTVPKSLTACKKIFD